VSTYLVDDKGFFRDPKDIHSQMTDKGFNCLFLADSCYQLMFLNPEYHPSYNTVSFESLVGLSLIEAGTTTQLHQKSGVNFYEPEPRGMDSESIQEHMLHKGFPIEKTLVTNRNYFNNHRNISRITLCHKGIMEWLRTNLRTDRGLLPEASWDHLTEVAYSYLKDMADLKGSELICVYDNMQQKMEWSGEYSDD